MLGLHQSFHQTICSIVLSRNEGQVDNAGLLNFACLEELNIEVLVPCGNSFRLDCLKYMLLISKDCSRCR
ncbi:hypothetical protein L873DRAFT_671624 [Choiromyces venosus 120613-1]|uniref:Uncharacterized protein n=1 Tax=Choiromyces venosus 120613-1 TaxID=1336337 RepID=A0A3N4JYT5_9PEZI|nr:hypothetical protein L873DRAFT_671624 [Choiromyces venosus 120613-1]